MKTVYFYGSLRTVNYSTVLSCRSVFNKLTLYDVVYGFTVQRRPLSNRNRQWRHCFSWTSLMGSSLSQLSTSKPHIPTNHGERLKVDLIAQPVLLG
jgi:hypothetical protein